MHSRQAVLLSFLLLCLQISTLSQVRVFAGPQMTTAAYSIRNVDQPTEWKGGFMAGIGLTNQVEGPLYFSPSLYFSRKGYKVTFNSPSVPPASAAKNNNTAINSIALAPLLQFNLSKKKNHIFFRFGPAIEVAISGKEIFDTAANKTVNRSMLFDPTAYSRTTFFATAHLGFEHQSGVGIFAYYEHGLSSLNNADLGPTILNRVVGVSLQWKFTSPRSSPAKQ